MTDGLLEVVPPGLVPPKKPRPSIYKLGRSPKVAAKVPGGITTCMSCPARDSCIRASAFGMVDTKHPEKLVELVMSQLYNARPDEEAVARMEAGTRIHRILEKRRGVLMEPREIIQALQQRRSVAFSLGICSVRYMTRGTPDVVYAEFREEAKPPMTTGLLRITVVDDKSHMTAAYANQIHDYALAFTDPMMMYVPPYAWDKEEDEKADLAEREEERRFFWEDINWHGRVEVRSKFAVYKKHGDDPDAVESPDLEGRDAVSLQGRCKACGRKLKRKIVDPLRKEEAVRKLSSGPCRRCGSRYYEFQETDATLFSMDFHMVDEEGHPLFGRRQSPQYMGIRRAREKIFDALAEPQRLAAAAQTTLTGRNRTWKLSRK